VPKAFKEADSAQTAPASSATSTSWWTIYADKQLDDLINQVELKNFTLQMAEARVKQAQALAASAHSEKQPSLIIGGANDLGIRLNWEIDLWGRIERNIESANASTEASLADLAAVKLAIQAQLAQNYFLLRTKDAEIQILEEIASAHEKLLQITRNQYAVGVVDKGNIVQAQAQFNAAQTQTQDARITRAQLEHAIAVLIGKAPADFSISSAALGTNLPLIPASLPSDLLQRRADIAAAERRMLAANARIGAAIAANYPKLDFSGGVSIRKGGLGGPRLTAPLYSEAPNAPRDKATAEYDEIIANYRQVVLNSFLEVEDNLSAQTLLNQAYEAQKQAVVASQESTVIAQNQYNAGILTYQAMLEIKATALNNQRAALTLLGRRYIASVTLIKALGGGWETNPESVVKPRNGS
jgi:NodT family efflux transporter outer membrane factor (OMF) lipoprotein